MRATLALPLLLALLTPALAAARPPDAPARSGPYAVELTDEHGRTLPTFQHDGRTYVLGARGERYLVRVQNRSDRRAEVVVSVDGRDVLDGEPSALAKRGYLVEAWSEVTIDGFRLSREAVAAFRFSPVSASYAARMGDARDVGVIGVAVYPERVPPPPPPPVSRPWWRGPGLEEERADRLRSDEAPARSPAPSASRADAESSAGGAAPRSAPAEKRTERLADSRPGLGTEFGEQHDSHVREVPFERASSRPAALLTLRYDDRRGLAALGIDVDGRYAAGDAWLREQADPFRRDAGFARPPPGWRR